MKGHIRERSPGHWAIVIELRDPTTGKRRRKWHAFAGTKRKAQEECSRLITALKGGTYLEPAKITVAGHMERWLEHVRSQVSPKTFERYCGVVRGNILPALGAVLLTKLQPAQISEMYANALSGGRKDGKGGGLSLASVLYMHRLLKQALAVAVTEWRLLPWNPADPIKAPRAKRKNMRALDTAETAALLEVARPYRLFVPVLLAVTCGLRRGEICALRWRSVELANAQLSINSSIEQTKAGTREKGTKTGRARTVALTTLA